MDTSVSIGRNRCEKSVGDIDCTFRAFRARIKDRGGMGFTVVVDVDHLAALGIGIWVYAVSHVDGVDCDEVLAVGARNSAGAETDGNIVVGHIAAVSAGAA